MAGEHYPDPDQTLPPGPGGLINYPAAPNLAQWLASMGLIGAGAMEPPKSGGFGVSVGFGGPAAGAGSSTGAAPQGANFGNVVAGGGSTAPTAAGAGGGMGWGNWINAAGTLLGAYSGYEQAKNSGKGGTVTTNQTTSQSPYGPSIDHLNRILEEQLRLYQAGPQGGGGGGGGAGGVGQFGKQAGDIFGQVASAGLGAGQTPNMKLAEGALGNIWQPGGATGFEGYNPILADLAGRLGGANLEMPTDLLLNFLGPGARGGGGAGGAGGGGGGFSYNAGGGGGGGMVPDTGAGNGTFQRELDRIFSEEANEEEIAAVLDSLRGDMERSLYAGIADIEARAQGQGRAGGSTANAEGQNARARYVEELGKISAQLRSADLNDRRNARLAALNILNSRDISAMNDLTQRAGISSAAGSAAAQTAMARELGLRGQDLEAIMGIMQGQQFGLSSLMGLGQQLSGDRLGSLSLIPSLEGVSLGGQQNALGAAGGLGALEEQEQRRRATAAANARASAAMPQQMLNDYLRTVLSIGGMGGTSTTQGTNVVPGTGISPLGGAAQGALGGYLTTAGLQERR